MTKVARKNVRETVAKCLGCIIKSGKRNLSDEAKGLLQEVLNQVENGTADNGAWAEAMSQIEQVVTEAYGDAEESPS